MRTVAPDADVDALDATASFHEQLDIDSVDFMNLMLGLEAKLGVHIPDVDYPKLSSLRGCLEYLPGLLAEKKPAAKS